MTETTSTFAEETKGESAAQEAIMKDTQTQEKTHPRLQQAYTTALLQFQAYLLEKRLSDNAALSRTRLIKMINCN